MMNVNYAKTNAKVKNKTARKHSAAAEKHGVGDIDKLFFAIIGGTASLIGIWALVCLCAGLSQLGGVVELGKSWIAAITGL